MSMEMSLTARAIAADVMARVMAHPIATTFQDGLVEILDNINAGKYRRVHEWLESVEQVWRELEEEDTDEAREAVAGECRKLFDKAVAKSGIDPLRTWCRSLFEAQKKLERERFSGPVKYRQLLGKRTKRRDTSGNDEEIRAVAQAIRRMGPNDLLEVAMILADTDEYCDAGSKEMWVDLRTLKPKTLDRLRMLVVTRDRS